MYKRNKGFGLVMAVFILVILSSVSTYLLKIANLERGSLDFSGIITRAEVTTQYMHILCGIKNPQLPKATYGTSDAEGYCYNQFDSFTDDGKTVKVGDRTVEYNPVYNSRYDFGIPRKMKTKVKIQN